MKKTLLILTLTISTFVLADEPQTTPAQAQQVPQQSNFPKDKIEQLAAPIALYPDALLAQVLMASTYPTEIAQAAKWLKDNPELQPSDIDAEIQNKRWDPSVKSLLSYPEVLNKMSGNLDWTRDLGDAVLAQQKDVLAAVQSLRAKANEAGNLKTDKNQTVSLQPDDIQIQPANDQQVYVPSYDPVTVYGGGWSYPNWYYPNVYNWHGIPWWYNSHRLYGNCDWNNHRLYTDNQKFNNLYNNNPNLKQDLNNEKQNVWQHNPDHRNGVPYRNPEVQNRYAKQLEAEHNNLNQYKGYHQTGASMPRNQNLTQNMQRNNVSVQHLENELSSYHQGQGRMNAFSGCANPKVENAYRNRGDYSRSSTGNYHGGEAHFTGGGSHGGGGGGHGGGGGGHR